MKNFAKLVLFFSLCFIIIFVAAAGLRFLSIRVDWARNLPVRPETSLTLLITAAHWALSLSLFVSILFSLSYGARKGYFAPMTIIIIMGFSILGCFGLSTLLDYWKAVPPAQTAGIPLGNKGLILSNSLNRNETSVILLNGTSDALGPRVIAIPEQPMIFQETAGMSNMVIPPVQFGNDTPDFLKSIAIDIRLNAEMFQRKFSMGFYELLIYAGALIFVLCSLGYAIKISSWPLANLFLGILAFRGILAAETFLNTPEMQEIIGSFIRNMIPISYALPLIFIAFGILLYLYSFLVFISRRRTADDEY